MAHQKDLSSSYDDLDFDDNPLDMDIPEDELDDGILIPNDEPNNDPEHVLRRPNNILASTITEEHPIYPSLGAVYRLYACWKSSTTRLDLTLRGMVSHLGDGVLGTAAHCVENPDPELYDSVVFYAEPEVDGTEFGAEPEPAALEISLLANYASLNDAMLPLGHSSKPRDFALMVAKNRPAFIGSPFLRPAHGPLGKEDNSAYFLGVNSIPRCTGAEFKKNKKMPFKEEYIDQGNLLLPNRLTVAVGKAKIDPDEETFFLHDMSTSRSSSGSAILDEFGFVFAMHIGNAKPNADGKYDSETRNRAVRFGTRDMKQFLAQVMLPQLLTPEVMEVWERFVVLKFQNGTLQAYSQLHDRPKHIHTLTPRLHFPPPTTPPRTLYPHNNTTMHFFTPTPIPPNSEPKSKFTHERIPILICELCKQNITTDQRDGWVYCSTQAQKYGVWEECCAVRHTRCQNVDENWKVYCLGAHDRSSEVGRPGIFRSLSSTYRNG
ncbi:hypothetical protein BJ508DRAFT_366313 [Ascobolus immersus RN42]|uniref:Peptidase S1 domain-containing protein n=1 Tax=Ascobolus immersus RN42 TaxID=1160509 RepID=A0A3N4HM16_ASCIM|nr:hypothetical protein BJ508DRAFT_366313 [Ascobolus immersus RN42]